MMFEITGFHSLMEEEPVGRKSRKIREKNSASVVKYSTVCTHEITEKKETEKRSKNFTVLYLEILRE